jgi:imidazolonepropionase
MKCIKDLSQLITLKSAHYKDGRNLKPEDLSIINNGAIVYNEEEILWVGDSESVPSEFSSAETISRPGHVLTPEIVDSHTHLVFGGNRSHEYTMRLNGADYEEIAKAGGGILSTMTQTNIESLDELFNKAIERIERINSYGIGTIEIKSGYSLTYEREKEITRLIHKLKEHFRGKVQIHNTYLAAHAVPKEFTSSENYLEKVVIPLLEELSPEGIIDSVDIFHEEGYFCKKDSETLFNKAQELNIPVRIHADEFNDNKAAILAHNYDALSCDHLLCTGQDGIDTLSKSNTVATLLPGTAFFLGKPLANAKTFLDSGCKVALASDYNPGSCHCDNLLLLASLSAKNMGFNIAQLWSAITLNAAHSLNLKDQGSLVEGLKPRFTLFKTESIDEVTYNWGRNLSVSI